MGAEGIHDQVKGSERLSVRREQHRAAAPPVNASEGRSGDDFDTLFAHRLMKRIKQRGPMHRHGMPPRTSAR